MIEAGKTKDGTARYDVIVVGGGTAGWIAALAAARAGKTVLVIDKKGHLGGTLTTGMPLHGFFNARHQQVVSGMPEEFVRRLKAAGGASDFLYTDLWFAVYVVTNPPILRSVIFDMLTEAGVDILLFSQIVDVVVDERSVKGVLVQKKTEQELFFADTFIDASGDAVLCTLADVPMQPMEECQPPSLIFRIENVDITVLRRYIVEHPDVYMDGRMLPGKTKTKQFLEDTCFFYLFQDKVGKIQFKGGYSPFINRFMFTTTPDNQGVVVNMLRALHVDGNKTESLTQATIHLYKNLIPLVESFRKEIPGFERCTLCDSEPEIQLRETKRIVGDYTMSADDVIQGKFFEDTIAVGGYFLDIHSSVDSAGIWKLLENPYGIPYQALIPQTLDNVLTAGRIISGSREAAASYRVMATCMAMGQAAGTAAALAAGCRGKFRDIDIEELRIKLRTDKAIIEL